MMVPQKVPKMYCKWEVSLMTGLSLSTLDRKMRAREMVFFKSGRNVRFPHEALMKWIDANTFRPKEAA